jgi:hypothetical protein
MYLKAKYKLLKDKIMPDVTKKFNFGEKYG